RTEQKSWRPEMLSFASAALAPVTVGTVSVLHTVVLSAVAMFGVAEPDHVPPPPPPQFPVNVSDHETILPVSTAARSWTRSCQLPVPFFALNAGSAMLVMTMLS